MFYTTTFDGILLVYDLANSVSRRNLEKWRQEWQLGYFGGAGGQSVGASRSMGIWPGEEPDNGSVLSPNRRSRDVYGGGGGGGGGLDLRLDLHRGASASQNAAMPPVLTIGNKLDLVGTGAAGRGAFDGEVEGGQGCHEIAVAACRKYAFVLARVLPSGLI